MFKHILHITDLELIQLKGKNSKPDWKEFQFNVFFVTPASIAGVTLAIWFFYNWGGH